MYPDDPLNCKWTFWALLITFPISVISFTHRYVTDLGGNYVSVLIIQLIMWIPTFFIISKFITKRKKIKSKPVEQ